MYCPNVQIKNTHTLNTGVLKPGPQDPLPCFFFQLSLPYPLLITAEASID